MGRMSLRSCTPSSTRTRSCSSAILATPSERKNLYSVWHNLLRLNFVPIGLQRGTRRLVIGRVVANSSNGNNLDQFTADSAVQSIPFVRTWPAAITIAGQAVTVLGYNAGSETQHNIAEHGREHLHHGSDGKTKRKIRNVMRQGQQKGLEQGRLLLLLRHVDITECQLRGSETCREQRIRGACRGGKPFCSVEEGR